MCESLSYVWYVGYGSNLCEERFLCYIRGGKFKWGGREATGCKDKTLPMANKPFRVPHSLYFAKRSGGWGDGGVAFVPPNREPNENNWVFARIWKITHAQFLEVWEQEGNSDTWYGKKIFLGEDEEGIAIYTITNAAILEPNQPSKGYLRTMALGLKETYNLTDEEIAQYLMHKSGIKENFAKDELMDIITLATSSHSRLKANR